jgi:outer membrane protein TolC
MTRYQPAPLIPADSAAVFEARSLDDPALRAFTAMALDRETELWPPAVWDPAHLTAAALYYHPDVTVARAALQIAEAGIITAGARPNPTLDASGGYSQAPESPFVFDTAFNLTFETAGKRRYRIAGAERQVEAARFHMAFAGWQVRMRLRSTLLELLTAEREVESLRSEVGLRQQVARLTERQVEAGELATPVLQAARVDLLSASVQLRTSETQVQQDRAALATALGLGAGALERATFLWPDLDQPLGTTPITHAQLQHDAVLNRLDLREALGVYAGTEAALQLEIAKQYPDFRLGPAYSFDDGSSRFILGMGLALPIFDRNQGPIAEALARRRQAGAQFLALQAQVIGAAEKALATYRGVLADLAEADRLVSEQGERERLAQRAFEAGDTDNLALTGMRVLTIATVRARVEALKRAETALGDLENAVQRPLQRSWEMPRLPTVSNPDIDLLRTRTQ